MKNVSVLKAIAITALVSSAIFAGQKLVLKETGSPVSRMVKDLQTEEKVGAALMMGCIQKGMEDDRLMPTIMMSGGAVCMQVISQDLQKELDGKGYCNLSDEKCLFKIGYVKTAMALGYPVGTEEEVQARETEAEESYAKSGELRGGQ